MGVKAEEDENRVIAERVYIGDVSVAGMTEEEATAAVEDYIESLQDTAITLKAGENSIEVTAKDLGVTWGNPELAEKAVNLGRTGNPIARYKEKKYSILLALLIGLCTGSIIELFQFILPVNRSVQLSDIVYNGISGFLGGCYFYLLNLISTKKRKEINN